MDLRDLIESEQFYDLSQPLFNGAPDGGAHVPYRMSFGVRHGDNVLADGFSWASEILHLSSHSGTHVDALSHVSEYGKVWGGLEAAVIQAGPRGMRELGIDTVRPIVRRGVLLDVTGHRGESAISPETGVTDAELEEIARAQQTEIRPGDVVLVRTGWARFWNDAPRYLGQGLGIAGPDLSAAKWLAARGIFMAGGDTLPFEWLPPNPTSIPCHVELLVHQGIHILENANLEALAADRVREFLLIAAPLPLVGCTGGPVRPLAIPLKRA